MIDVNEASIVGWELNHCQPLTRHIPRIINFLGDVPENHFPANTLGQKIKRYRLIHGMTRKELARQLCIDEATLCRFESDKGKPFPAILK